MLPIQFSAQQSSSPRPKLHTGAHLTIRSSRDRFAARLMRYRIAHRRAAKQSGLTQVLGRRRNTFTQRAIESSPATPAVAPWLRQPRPACGITQTRYASAWWQILASTWSARAPAATQTAGFMRLTIRSSRDRFAARLMRYRVAQRRVAQRPDLTQVLGL